MGSQIFQNSKYLKSKILKYLGEERKKVRAEQLGLVLAFVWRLKKTWGTFIQSRELIL